MKHPQTLNCTALKIRRLSTRFFVFHQLQHACKLPSDVCELRLYESTDIWCLPCLRTVFGEGMDGWQEEYVGEGLDGQDDFDSGMSYSKLLGLVESGCYVR